ncbi:MAG: HAD-IB family hydrolase [Ilumatobacteraceae bacterium]
MHVVVAAFDVDNTLTVRDCVVPFMQRIAGRLGFLKACVSRPLVVGKMVMARDRDALKAHFIHQVFAGKDVEHVTQQGVDFAAQVVSSWMRQDVTQRMRWHQSQGHVVVLVSASLDVYLNALGDLCEVDAVLCTELEHDSGVFTGNIVGNNCRGDEKVRRLQDWMSSAGISSNSLIYAYGDSSGDTVLLNAAQCGYNVKHVDNLLEHV